MEPLDVDTRSPPEKKPKLDDESGVEDLRNGSSESRESAISTTGSSESKGSPMSTARDEESSEDEMEGVILHLDNDVISDDDEYTYSKEDAEKYLQQIKQTGGYEVDYYKGIGQQGGVQPIKMPLLDWQIGFYTEIVEHAMREYDKENDTHLQLVEITQLNCECGGLVRSYLTFQAKNGDDGDVKIYQTRARLFPGGEVIEEFRLKPGVN